ncbi:MAG: NAD-dependent protein deacetylase [Gammaproteobacteria bacterium]|jgi:NAD-dependent SIR2 family protein deacetylase|nr:NAD-dependent protein deacetylase [Gammaproteobacteria bacterium]
MPATEIARLLLDRAPVLALTGAGCSTRSGIPDYRDADGGWKHARPVLYQDFLRDAGIRSRYWARSTLGWPRFAAAAPNPAHAALARLEDAGIVQAIVTQNVDGLHQLAGSRAVVDLHGRLDRVRCLDCGQRLARAAWQQRLASLNPGWNDAAARLAPDGDAVPTREDLAGFRVPGCDRCGGIVKPDVVFYGEAIPEEVRAAAAEAVARAGAVLVVGSSLMVWSGYRLVRDAAATGKPVVAINLGRTRGDDLLACHWRTDCAGALPELAGMLGAR